MKDFSRRSVVWLVWWHVEYPARGKRTVHHLRQLALLAHDATVTTYQILDHAHTA